MTESLPTAPLLTSLQVRDRLVEALRLDLVGPSPGNDLAEEQLPRYVRPSTWYLTGFLAPRNAPPEEAADTDADDDLAVEAGPEGLGDEAPTDPTAAKKTYYPSSMGLSVLVAREATTLEVLATWGEYVHDQVPTETEEEGAVRIWRRVPREERVDIPLSGDLSRPILVPRSEGLEVSVLVRDIPTASLQQRIPDGTRSVSIFLVNGRRPDADAPDRAYVFQPQVEVTCDVPFVPGPDLRGILAGNDAWDEQVADLQFRNVYEFATGHGVSANWDEVDGACRKVRTAWIPSAEVEKTETATVPDVELGMDALGTLPDADGVRRSLGALVDHYRAWIASRTELTAGMSVLHRSVAEELTRRASIAAERIERGVRVLERDEQALDAFRMANRAVARALRQRLDLTSEPTWRPFQLAFLLLNLPGIADPTEPDRETVDLLFFPTGGGKTEAYLGLAAFTMVLRRLRHSDGAGGLSGAGVAVVMRYTLRLLTLDQLGRAAGLMCALELERECAPERYGTWPFEIGLWVGKAATPNVMGRKGDGREGTARKKVQAFKRDPKYRSIPIPLEACPWCGTPFEPASFNLVPNDDEPRELVLTCTNFECDFSGSRRLPIVAVDEPLYRRLPAFLIATVDKFASLPWTGASGMLLGRAKGYDGEGFYGPVDTNRGKPLPAAISPPDLIIQDELHLISGPLGTMTGLFETAVDALCTRVLDGRTVRPKVVASTATARHADSQVQSVFGRPSTQLFPPPGIDRSDSFFARVVPSSEVPARLYLGVSAQGRSAKVVMRRTWLALMGAAEKAYVEAGGKQNPENPADPYMTVLGYFNSLRELGGARRILEEEVRHTVREYGGRLRFGRDEGLFHNRRRIWDVVELTSRVNTSRVAAAKRQLEKSSSHDRFVEAAVATNMISVGLDISRLGLMVVLGQPKSHAEYIQATSRVGRDDARPGLVVTLLNLAKPRDRSHYERFRHYHETFYRSLEVASVTPFAARALDRGFAGAMVALARHVRSRLTPPGGANEIKLERTELEDYLRNVFTERVGGQPLDSDELAAAQHQVESRVSDLLDAWVKIQETDGTAGVALRYQRHEGNGNAVLLREMLDHTGESVRDKFRVNRSLRDVEPEVALYIQDLPVGTWGSKA